MFIAQGRRTFPPTQSHRPYGTVFFLDAFQAVNCQATIILSLRDNKLVRHLSVKSTPDQPVFLEDKDDDDYGERQTASAERQLLGCRGGLEGINRAA